MQISKITSVQNINNIKRLREKQNIKNTNVSRPQYDLKTMYTPYFGRDIVVNQKPSFDETLKKNYFQLPPTATPDEFQKEAGRALLEGKDVLVEAPTGTGKTAIAHYATTNNMAKGKTTFYTTPLKALSNQKLNEFRNVYGEDKVGILTGDRRENVDAPIIIMTTEVYRNMALANKYGDKNPLMENLGTVIFDELHYLGDPDRGPVWEESLMYTPKDVQTLGLSATIGNPKELTNWISNLDGNNVHLVSIPESARHVPLTFDTLDTEAYQEEQKKADNKLKKDGTVYETPKYAIDTKPTPSDFKLSVDKLKNKNQLPAIFFVFSRNYSRQLLDYLGQQGQPLTTDKERKQIEDIVESHKAKGYIGSDLNEQALMNGYVIHNAGIIPGQKELVEELFQKKLVKVVLATETLAAGINMPAKTVVISSPYKPTDDVKDTKFEEMSIRALTANEFKQMSGRAGRRGIDEIGYVYTMPTNMATELEFLNLEVMKSNPINSRYNPDYGFLSGYYENHEDSKELEDLFAQSFYAYSEDDDISLERQEKLLELADKKSMVLMERGFLEVDDEGNVHPTILAKMAAKVRGYDAITLVETIASKVLDGVTPEALAAFAGGIANPPKTSEKQIEKSDDLSKLYNFDSRSVDNAFNRIYSSVQASLKRLGKSLESFSSYDEALEFARAIEKPEGDEKAVARRLKELKSIHSRIQIITKPVKQLSEQYSLDDIVAAIKNGDAIPTDVLELYIKELATYIKGIKTVDIETHISNLELEKESVEAETPKGNKAKDYKEKHLAGLDTKLATAKKWQIVEANLYDTYSSNKKFIKEHSSKQISRELKGIESLYAQLTAKDRLVKGIQGLKSLEQYELEHNLQHESKSNVDILQKSFDKLITKGLEVYSSESGYEIESKPKKYGRNATQTLYNWALMNKMNSDSLANWLELLSSTDENDADEGTLYRRVMQTADLISQITEIASVGCKESKTEEDKAYYNQLKQTALQTRDLLIREPATV